MKKKKGTQVTNSMNRIGPHISILTLNVNGQNAPHKIYILQIQENWIKRTNIPHEHKCKNPQ